MKIREINEAKEPINIEVQNKSKLTDNSDSDESDLNPN